MRIHKISFHKINAANLEYFWPEGIIESIPFPSRPSFLKGGVTNRSNSTSISSGLGSSISNNNTSSPPSYSRIIPPSVGTNRTSGGSVHSNSPKFVNCNASKNEAMLPSGQPQTQTVATRSASVPSGTSVLKHQQRSLPAPPCEAKSVKDSIVVSTPSTTMEENNPRDTSRVPPSFYHNRGDYFKL